MMNYILEKNNFTKKDFWDEHNKSDEDAFEFDEDTKNIGTVHNLNYVL